MKTAVLVLVVAFLAIVKADLSQESKDKLAKHHDVCSASSHVKQDLVANTKKGQFADDENLKQYFFCVMKRVGFINDQAEVQEAVVRAKAGANTPKIAMDALIGVCKDLKGKDVADTAMLKYKCFYEGSSGKLSLVV